jgi:type II restriction enzyme
MESSTLERHIESYKSDPESVYNTWFVSSAERMKAFRSIRRGVQDVVESIGSGTFGNDFKGSPLEHVLAAITEQKQVFEGAAHPFYWKPKLRIPDIYENEANKRAFGAFLAACLNASKESQVLTEMSRLSALKIKGLGPACANIVYFLHPTLVPPFNTAMVNGYNALFGTRMKLGDWGSYLQMREVIVQTNNEVRHLLSKDLGAFAGLLFEVGTGRLLVEGNSEAVIDHERAKAEKAARDRHAQVVVAQKEESEHTRMQYLLTRVGRALGYDVYVARNDRHRSLNGESFQLLTVPDLPQLGGLPETSDVRDTIELIDVIWIDREGKEIVSAFEVEKSTSIYSGILRLEDLARSIPGCTCHFYLLAPASREKEVMAQLTRPAFRDSETCSSLNFITFEALSENCDALCTFGDDHRILHKIARTRAG